MKVQFEPKIWKGQGVFVGLKLGVSDSFRKVLTTVALQKTAGRRSASSADSEPVPLIWRGTRTTSAAITTAADFAIILILMLGALLVW